MLLPLPTNTSLELSQWTKLIGSKQYGGHVRTSPLVRQVAYTAGFQNFPARLGLLLRRRLSNHPVLPSASPPAPTRSSQDGLHHGSNAVLHLHLLHMHSEAPVPVADGSAVVRSASLGAGHTWPGGLVGHSPPF